MNSTVPSFDSTLGSANALYLLESTLRKWQGPGGRAVRLSIKSTAGPASVAFGSSGNVAAVAGSAVIVLQGTAEVFGLQPSWNTMAVVSSTDTVVNVTLGYGQ